jgi:hypothetical protein
MSALLGLRHVKEVENVKDLFVRALLLSFPVYRKWMQFPQH